MQKHGMWRLWGSVVDEVDSIVRGAGGTVRCSTAHGASNVLIQDLQDELGLRLNDDHVDLLTKSNGITITCSMPLETLPYHVRIVDLSEIANGSRSLEANREAEWQSIGRPAPPRSGQIAFADSFGMMITYRRELSSNGQVLWPASKYDEHSEFRLTTEYDFTSWIATIPERARAYVRACSNGGLIAFLNSWGANGETDLPF